MTLYAMQPYYRAARQNITVTSLLVYSKFFKLLSAVVNSFKLLFHTCFRQQSRFPKSNPSKLYVTTDFMKHPERFEFGLLSTGLRISVRQLDFTPVLQVYYQCTQRAKLGCGSLCHVVYHHVGTALLYTNGEPHNHIEYNSILNSNPPPANVAISNLNVQVRLKRRQRLLFNILAVCQN